MLWRGDGFAPEVLSECLTEYVGPKVSDLNPCNAAMQKTLRLKNLSGDRVGSQHLEQRRDEGAKPPCYRSRVPGRRHRYD